MTDFNLSIHLYHNSNITKLNLQLASLLTKYTKSENEKCEFLKFTFNKIENKQLNFNTISEAVDYLIKNNFEKIDISNYNNLIHISFYCDGISGYKYRDLEDFKNRFDIPHFNELFKDKIILPNQVNKLLYFIYYNDYLQFPEINEKAKEIYLNNNDIFESELLYEDYLT